ncbi:MAG: hypothetical protein ACI3X9_07040 [Bacteroidaceae bacterium]
MKQRCTISRKKKEKLFKKTQIGEKGQKKSTLGRQAHAKKNVLLQQFSKISHGIDWTYEYERTKRNRQNFTDYRARGGHQV